LNGIVKLLGAFAYWLHPAADWVAPRAPSGGPFQIANFADEKKLLARR